MQWPRSQALPCGAKLSVSQKVYPIGQTVQTCKLNNILQSERSIHGRWLALVGGCPNRHGEGSHRLRPQQRTVVGFDDPVTFADGFMQGFNIGDLNMAPRILYHSSLLKVRACSVTLVRLTPNISARNSWVNCRLSITVKSRVLPRWRDDHPSRSRRGGFFLLQLPSRPSLWRDETDWSK